MKRKIIYIVLSAVLLLCGCSSQSGGNSEGESMEVVFESEEENSTEATEDITEESSTEESETETTVTTAEVTTVTTKSDGPQLDGSIYYHNSKAGYAINLPNGWNKVTDEETINKLLKVESNMSTYDIFLDDNSGDYIIIIGINTGGTAIPDRDFNQTYSSFIISTRLQGINVTNEQQGSISGYRAYQYSGVHTDASGDINITGWLMNMTSPTNPLVLNIAYYDIGGDSTISANLPQFCEFDEKST